MAWFNFKRKTGNPPAGAEMPATENARKDMGVHKLYAILDRDNEQKGYDDALINPNAAHMEQGVQIIQNELLRTIDQIKVYYTDYLFEIDFHIESRRTNAMFTTVEELQMKKEVARKHLEKVLEIEQASKNGQAEKMGIVMTYRRGFQKGLAAISYSGINKFNH